MIHFGKALVAIWGWVVSVARLVKLLPFLVVVVMRMMVVVLGAEVLGAAVIPKLK
jgi:hypothetical protein